MNKIPYTKHLFHTRFGAKHASTNVVDDDDAPMLTHFECNLRYAILNCRRVVYFVSKGNLYETHERRRRRRPATSTTLVFRSHAGGQRCDAHAKQRKRESERVRARAQERAKTRPRRTDGKEKQINRTLASNHFVRHRSWASGQPGARRTQSSMSSTLSSLPLSYVSYSCRPALHAIVCPLHHHHHHHRHRRMSHAASHSRNVQTIRAHCTHTHTRARLARNPTI